MDISIIIPFYHGNDYLATSVGSCIRFADYLRQNGRSEEAEILLVNDSPEEGVDLAAFSEKASMLRVITNEKNMGIHATRVRGLRECLGEWVIFLDQDDELMTEGMLRQLDLRAGSDVVVGNGLDDRTGKARNIYKNERVMKYLIQRDRFIDIRNLIVSPGQCMIRKAAIPELWINKLMRISGADDWYLWILMFEQRAAFACNEQTVYYHHTHNEENLSYNIRKMKGSVDETYGVLAASHALSEKDLEHMRLAIGFKFYQDTHGLTPYRLFEYRRAIFKNILYRINIALR